MNLYSFSVICFSFGVLLTAVLALVKRKDAVSARFTLFSVSVCGWGFTFALWINQNYSAEMTLLWVQITYVFVVFIPITWLHFVLTFIRHKEPFKYFFPINYMLSVLFALFCPTKLFFTGTHPLLEFKYLPTPGLVHHFHIVHFFTLVPAGLYFLLKAYRRVSGQEKEQLKYMLAGTMVGFMAGGTIYLAFYKIPFPMYLLALMPLYPILTSIALIRHGLFDVQQIADAFQREKLAAIGTMAASLNHELRNPLFVAKGKIEAHLDALAQNCFITDREKIEKSHATLQVAYDHLSRAMDIMQRFSDFAKPLGQAKDKQRVGIREVLEDVLGLVSSEFQMEKIKLKEFSVNGEYVYANRRQLEEIFFNLILNACHAMGEKGGELRLRSSKKNGKIIVEVLDTGPGIPKENQRKIFEPFYSTKGGKGSGLGLYITKQLIERNGGKIFVKSKINCGTNFSLIFKSKSENLLISTAEID